MLTRFFKAATVCLAASITSAQASDQITFGLTTTQEASGFAKALLSHMRERFPDIDLSYSVSGTSQLLRALEEGFVPFGITHNIHKEQALISTGHHTRTPLFSNDFLFVGPKDSAIECDAIAACLNALSKTEEVFLSRGDQSGTHAYELEQWDAVDIDPMLLQNYQIASGGAANSLRICSVRKCYLIVDESTLNASANNKLVEIARDRGSNVYSLIHAHDFSHKHGPDILHWMAREAPEISEQFGYRAK